MCHFKENNDKTEALSARSIFGKLPARISLITDFSDKIFGDTNK